MATGQPARPVAARARGRKKTLLIDQALLDRARQALGVRTETDTVRLALEAVLRREEQAQGIRALATLGPIDPARID
jgi:hypothetical protein